MVHGAAAAAEAKAHGKESHYVRRDSHLKTMMEEVFGATIIFEILDAMSLRQDTAISYAKQLNGYAHDQNVLNNENAQIHFVMVPRGADNDVIQQYGALNSELAAMREDIQNELVENRQTSQVTMTLTSTAVQMLSEDASEGTGCIHKLGEMCQSIIDMTQQGS